MTKRIEFTWTELKAMTESPDALRAVADWHDVQATIADGGDWRVAAKSHEDRAADLRAEAKRLEGAYEAGYGPGFDD